MANSQQPAKARRCEGLIIENGGFRRRWVDEITLHVEGKLPRTLRGAKLPQVLVINTGASQEAETVVELFYDKLPSPTVVNRVLVERSPGLNGRDVLAFIVGGIMSATAIAVTLASFDALATAVSF